MESCFFVEAKAFSFSVEVGKPKLSVEERRKGFLGPQSVAWLIVTMEEVMQTDRIVDFVNSNQEASKVLTVRRGGNRDGWFLVVLTQTVGGRRNIIVVLEGREGRGWSRFAGELSKVMAFFEAMK
jgi:hypothetical protein